MDHTIHNSQLAAFARIRDVIGDPCGNLDQPEVIERVKLLVEIEKAARIVCQRAYFGRTTLEAALAKYDEHKNK